VGGTILVADAGEAPASVDRNEIVSGADAVCALVADDGGLPHLDPAGWRPRAARRLIDEEARPPAPSLYRIGDSAVLVDAPGEPPVALVAGRVAFGRWADGAVVVLVAAGGELAPAALELLAAARPKLLALAAPEAAVDAVFAAARDRLAGAA